LVDLRIPQEQTKGDIGLFACHDDDRFVYLYTNDNGVCVPVDELLRLD
jgi:hypothetical protein